MRREATQREGERERDRKTGERRWNVEYMETAKR